MPSPPASISEVIARASNLYRLWLVEDKALCVTDQGAGDYWPRKRKAASNKENCCRLVMILAGACILDVFDCC